MAPESARESSELARHGKNYKQSIIESP
jgi:hypothetical protein